MTAHPDKGGSEAKMAAINEAYEVLSNPGMSMPPSVYSGSSTDTRSLFQNCVRGSTMAMILTTRWLARAVEVLSREVSLEAGTRSHSSSTAVAAASLVVASNSISADLAGADIKLVRYRRLAVSDALHCIVPYHIYCSLLHIRDVTSNGYDFTLSERGSLAVACPSAGMNS